MGYNKFLSETLKIHLPIWSILFPVMAIVILFRQGTFTENPYYLTFLGLILIAAVLSSVHHAEVIAHKVGEPFGTIILAVSIAVIEVSLIVSLMISEGNEQPSTLARDTVFAAIMIILTGIIGLCLWSGGYKYKQQKFRIQGVNTALIALIAISILTLVLPNYTVTGEGGAYSNKQLIFVAIISLILYGGFISMQTIRHRDFFLPKKEDSDIVDSEHADPPTLVTTIISLILLILALVAVVLLSKKLSPAIEEMVLEVGAPQSLVGIIIATVILLPEGMAAWRAAQNNRLQTSLNLSLGSALASIGLTIPAVAIVSFFTGMTVTLGIDAKSTLLLILSLFIVYLSLNSGKTNILPGIVLLILFATYLFTTIVP